MNRHDCGLTTAAAEVRHRSARGNPPMAAWIISQGHAGRKTDGRPMIRKIKSGYRIYSRKKNPRTGRRRNLGTFKTKKAAEKHEREIQYFKRH
jgi:hypothetical protein